MLSRDPDLSCAFGESARSFNQAISEKPLPSIFVEFLYGQFTSSAFPLQKAVSQNERLAQVIFTASSAAEASFNLCVKLLECSLQSSRKLLLWFPTAFHEGPTATLPATVLSVLCPLRQPQHPLLCSHPLIGLQAGAGILS